jgi:hypothetical protein
VKISVKFLTEVEPWWIEAFPECSGSRTGPEASAPQADAKQEGDNRSNQSRSGPAQERAAGPSKADDSGGHAPQSGLWYPDISDYQIAHFFGLEEVNRIRRLLDLERKNDQNRLHKFVEGLIAVWGWDRSMPEPWQVAVAGFPLVAERIKAPALLDIVRCITEERPYEGRKQRKTYHNAVRVHLRESWMQISYFLSPSGYDFVPRKSGPVIKANSLEEVVNHEPSAKDIQQANNDIERSLLKGQLVRSQMPGIRVPLESTRAGLIWDMLSRLPDVDRRRGQVFRRLSMKQLFLRWCAPGSPPVIKEATLSHT